MTTHLEPTAAAPAGDSAPAPTPWPGLNAPLEIADPEVAAYVAKEVQRQQQTLEMIASENFAPIAAMQAQGSVLTNKYAEGYPGRRYYGGCENVDVIESLAIERVKALFGAGYANVQPHSGASANAAAMAALIKPGDTILGLSLAHGGHLTHGMRINFSGLLYNVAAYEVSKEDYRIDMDEVGNLARQHQPKMIIAGWSAYPRHLDFVRFREIADEVGALLMVDMAHFAGLVATGLHPNPVPYAHVTTTTTHKTLGGPRGGVILSNDPAIAKKINSAVFPGQQGGPLEHVIAAKAVAFKMAADPSFTERAERTLLGARLLAERLIQSDVAQAGVEVLTGGTDVHLVLVDLRDSDLDGQAAEDRLHSIGITVNRNAVPFDPRPPMVTSGLRIGTPALATRGFGAGDFVEVADIIAQALTAPVGELDPAVQTALRARVSALATAHPLYPDLGVVV
ncbi:serine hydroxymethyltransferase [Nakamurella multipartita]|mgnify:CR=1 FL=1|jgi:glycine hydroxymethyltransferase|uniref:Serine hydroxymethyltransferase n=1 Tax=Nakamurella multipartita (strain ATCC 700099 / DSM 44233 / CIP 104796 / JCM 9543 / NBRC 105858 / Y-104) TaxID=479431 RepID=C8X896_NAKMY|nr:serine hydroxymethyltransferase [Nakamurella multipartita]ACV77072.1 Glycine hydroxymethyltransferase [Nakamurella multipartita DSM 44233]